MEAPLPPRLAQRQQTGESQLQSLGQNRNQREFASPEEMIRYDAANTPPPAELEPRLRASLRAEPARKRAWWSRWFGG